jgi:nickel superoxide dismutase
MLRNFLEEYLIDTAFAHCDIPCGIYDPYYAQTAAHTVIRMTQLIQDAKQEENEKELIHNISRYTKIKDEHAEIVKHEIRVIFGDYFKDEHLEQYPDLPNLVRKILKLASIARQEVDMQAAQDLLNSVQEFAEIFYKTKGLEVVRVKSPYPTGGEMVVYK